ncbi:MAG: sensor domain-containing diguanylate cyclase [Acidocella sp.]|nr:sensor domain-containing diguanylate cyclase [Acidocella sp.]
MTANLFEAVAYIAMAAAVSDLSMATDISLLGRRRGFLLTVLLAGAAVQMLIATCPQLGLSAMLPGLHLAAAMLLLGVPIGFWPAVARLKQGHINVWSPRLVQRAIRAERATAAANKWLDLAERNGHVGHWQISLPGRQFEWSDEVFRIFGLWRAYYTPELNAALAAFHPADSKRIAELIEEATTLRGHFEVAARLRRPDGEIRHVIMRGGVEPDPVSGRDTIAGIIIDVSDPKRAETKLASHVAGGALLLEDAVTGLADRRQFDISLGYEFKRAVRSRKPLGLVLLEIDHFQEFQGRFGAGSGDECLRHIAQAVQSVPRRTGDIVARYDDDTIAVLLPLADAEGAFKVGTAIAELVRSLGVSNPAHDMHLLTVSCGAAAFSGVDDLYNPLELTRRATAALHRAVDSGGNNVQMYLPALPREPVVDREWK